MRGSNLNKKRGMKAYIYIAPWMIGFLVFQFYPLLASLYYSLTDYSLTSRYNFIGIKNYIKMFTNDTDFFRSLSVTIKYVGMTLPSKLVFALFIAILLNSNTRFISFFRTVYYLPSVFGGSVTVAILWKYLFRRDGVVNLIVGMIGIPPQDWLGSPKWALSTFSLLAVWQFGSSMVLFLAGLKQIPGELYEAATVDGASKPYTFFRITIPMLSPIIFFNLIVQMINTFQEFTGAFVITAGGLIKSTYLYALMLYQQAFLHYNMGYAAALSWVFFIIMGVITIILFRWSTLWTFYEDTGNAK